MNKMTKIALATASVLSVGALTACQSTQAPNRYEAVATYAWSLSERPSHYA